MYPTTKFIALLALIGMIIPFNGNAQTDSTSLPVSSESLHRPTVEAGFGTLSYFGDIGRLQGIGKTAQLNWGYHLSMHNPISDAFGLDVFALFGNICHGERVIGNSANFKTDIRMGGLALTYNFDNILPAERNITPYISLGVGTFEFNSKTDMYDSEGNRYHYWNDGSIRNMAQDDINAVNAVLLTRDYKYETDLRARDGKETSQSLRALSIPLGVGANIHLNDKFNLRMGAEYHFSLTDDLDGVNSANLNPGTGRKGNDRFLYTSIGLSYNLHYNKKSQPTAAGISSQDLLALEYEDEDGDGVADIVDQCPSTPEGVQVDLYGCPLDSDKDGISDYQDEEPNSAPGALVNLDGVTLTDEDIETMYLASQGRLGALQYDKTQKYTDDFVGNRIKMTDRTKGFRIVITNMSNLSGGDISKMLSISDLKSVNTDKGMEFFVGDFDQMDEAVQRLIKLDQQGFEGQLVYNEFGKTTPVAKKDIEAVAAGTKMKEFDSEEVTFRVQIGAYRYKLSSGVFKEVPNLFVVEGNDGLIRYVAGSFDNIRDAAEYKIDLLLKGYEGAFVTAYKGGKRITLKEAGATVTSKEDISTSGPSGAINKEFVKFTIQLGSFNGRVPADILSKYMSLSKVRPIRAENGVTKYIYGSFDSVTDANTARKELADKGYADVFVVGEFNGQLISADEAQKIKTQ